MKQLLRLASAAALAARLLAGVAGCDGVGAPYLVDDPCFQPAANEGLPTDLRCTGLYADWDSKRLAGNVRPFSPGTTLWSDGASKQRWIDLPGGAGAIGSADPDQWRFPVGTRAWKEFSLGGRRVETRLFQKVRDGEVGMRWLRTTYVWAADGSRATRTDRGIADFEGTGYTVPATGDCDKCHEGRIDRLLGFEAFALGEPAASGFTLPTLLDEGRLSSPPASVPALPGSLTAPTRAALAWLHVNCGTSCHNRAADSTAGATGLLLRLEAEQLVRAASEGAEALDPIRTTVGIGARTGKWSGQVRIVAGAPEQSLLYRLATSRGVEQMPPIVSHLPDPEGTALLRAFIESL
jgi:hypothetical protein